MTLLRDITNILQYGQKTTSLKFAILRGIVDYVNEHASEVSQNNFHYIPIAFLAKKAIQYYLPFWILNIRQGTLPAGHHISLYGMLDTFQNNLKQYLAHPTLDSFLNETSGLKDTYLLALDNLVNIKQINTVLWVDRLLDLPFPLPMALLRLLHQVRKKLLQMPLKHIAAVNGETIRFFSLICQTVSFASPYHDHRTQAMQLRQPSKSISWLEYMNTYENTFLVLDDSIFQTLVKFRFWARDVISHAWLDYSLQVNANSDQSLFTHSSLLYLPMSDKPNDESKPASSHLYEQSLYYLLQIPYNYHFERHSALLQSFRRLYQKIAPLKCPFSGELFGASDSDSYHLDHFLPWHYYPVNRVWNLFPCDPDINLSKSDLLPELSPFIERNIHYNLQQIVQYLDEPIIRHDLTYFYHVLMKRPNLNLLAYSKEQIVSELLNYLKLELTRLHQIVPGRFTID